jgi:hypothetical protein
MGLLNIWTYDFSVALQTKKLYCRLGMIKQYIENQVLVSPLSIIITLVYVIMIWRLIKEYKFEVNNRLFTICQRFYKWLLFPIVVGFSYSSILSLYSEMSLTSEWTQKITT